MTARKRVVDVRRRTQPQLHSIKVLVLPDEDPDPSYLDQDEFEDRKEAFQRGDFHFIGIRAEAVVAVEGILQTLTSGGLWGVESDSGDDYIEGVAVEEYEALRDVLKSIGVSTAQLPVADRETVRSWIEWRE